MKDDLVKRPTIAESGIESKTFDVSRLVNQQTECITYAPGPLRKTPSFITLRTLPSIPLKEFKTIEETKSYPSKHISQLSSSMTSIKDYTKSINPSKRVSYDNTSVLSTKEKSKSLDSLKSVKSAIQELIWPAKKPVLIIDDAQEDHSFDMTQADNTDILPLKDDVFDAILPIVTGLPAVDENATDKSSEKEIPGSSVDPTGSRIAETFDRIDSQHTAMSPKASLLKSVLGFFRYNEEPEASQNASETQNNGKQSY